MNLYSSREMLSDTDLTTEEWKLVPKSARRVILNELGNILTGDSPDPLGDQGRLIVSLREVIRQAPYGFKTLSNIYLAERLCECSIERLRRGQERDSSLLRTAAHALREIARPASRVAR